MRPTVLIADGDAELCDLHRRFLSERGYQVEAAFDGLDCLTKLRQQTPAALVLDLELRWGGGDGVLDWIREEGSMRGIPVILTATAAYPQGPQGIADLTFKVDGVSGGIEISADLPAQTDIGFEYDRHLSRKNKDVRTLSSGPELIRHGNSWQ